MAGMGQPREAAQAVGDDGWRRGESCGAAPALPLHTFFGKKQINADMKRAGRNPRLFRGC